MGRTRRAAASTSTASTRATASLTILLGLTSGSRRNFPLETFGLDSSPYSGAFVQDFWKVRSNLTLGLGLRYEYWHAKSLRAGNGATFDPAIGKVIAGVDDDGSVNLSQQPVSPFLAAASQGLWVPANEVGIPGGLFKANGHFSPRVGLTWRPDVDQGLRGTRRLRHLLQQLHRQPLGLFHRRAAVLDVGGAVVQRADAAAVGDRVADRSAEVHPALGGRVPGLGHRRRRGRTSGTSRCRRACRSTRRSPFLCRHAPAEPGLAVSRTTRCRPGCTPNLQAAKPYPAFGEINVLENRGTAKYNGLQIKLERRFADGFSFTGSYSLAKDTVRHRRERRDRTASSRSCQPATCAGARPTTGVTCCGSTRSTSCRSAATALPERRCIPVADAILGGWQLSGINSFVSGAPLSINVPGATLGNGWGTRANLVGRSERVQPLGRAVVQHGRLRGAGAARVRQLADRRRRGACRAHPRPRADEELLDRRPAGTSRCAPKPTMR